MYGVEELRFPQLILTMFGKFGSAGCFNMVRRNDNHAFQKISFSVKTSKKKSFAFFRFMYIQQSCSQQATATLPLASVV